MSNFRTFLQRTGNYLKEDLKVYIFATKTTKNTVHIIT